MVGISFTEETVLLQHIFTELPHVRLQRAVTYTELHISLDRYLEFSNKIYICIGPFMSIKFLISRDKYLITRIYDAKRNLFNVDVAVYLRLKK